MNIKDDMKGGLVHELVLTPKADGYYESIREV